MGRGGKGEPEELSKKRPQGAVRDGGGGNGTWSGRMLEGRSERIVGSQNNFAPVCLTCRGAWEATSSAKLIVQKRGGRDYLAKNSSIKGWVNRGNVKE